MQGAARYASGIIPTNVVLFNTVFVFTTNNTFKLIAILGTLYLDTALF